jgi:26S proteasome regulatory subunit N1
MAHNAETEACDLLMEIERLDQLKDFVEAGDQPRVCRYLLSCVPYVPDPENVMLIHTAYDICIKHDARIDALRCAIMLNNVPLMKEIVLQTTER